MSQSSYDSILRPSGAQALDALFESRARALSSGDAPDYKSIVKPTGGGQFVATVGGGGESMSLEEVRGLFKYRVYTNMLKNGLPEGAVRQKMTMNQMKTLDQDIFFGDAPMPSEAAGVPISSVHKAEDALSDAAKEAQMLAKGGNAGMAKYGVGGGGGNDLLAAIQGGVQLKPVRQRHTNNVSQMAKNNLVAELKSTNRVANYGLKGRSEIQRVHDARDKVKRKTSGVNQNTQFGTHMLRKTSRVNGGVNVDTGVDDGSTGADEAQASGTFGTHMLRKSSRAHGGVNIDTGAGAAPVEYTSHSVVSTTKEKKVTAQDLKFGAHHLKKTGAGEGGLWATLV